MTKWPDQECAYSVPGGYCPKPDAWASLVSRIAELEGALAGCEDRFRVASVRFVRAVETLRSIQVELDESATLTQGKFESILRGHGAELDRVVYDKLIEQTPRIAELEGGLDDALEEIRQLRAWRERAWQAMREAGHEARGIMRRLDLEPTSGC